MNLLFSALTLFLFFYFGRALVRWRKRYLEAQTSGFSVYLVSFGPGPLVGYIGRLIGRWYDHVPFHRRPSWIQRTAPSQSLQYQFWPHQEQLAGSYVTVPFGGPAILWSADAEIITQVMSRRNDFPKPVEYYRILAVYGSNIVTTEGPQWREQRKLSSPAFSEANNRVVFAESIHQANLLLESWINGGSGRSASQKKQIQQHSPVIKTAAEDFMRLSLHVISRAGFGVQLPWPGVESKVGRDQRTANRAKELEKGRALTYSEALSGLLHHLITIVAVPGFLRGKLPFKRTEEANRSFREWGSYMNGLLDIKKTEISTGADENVGLDLIGALVKAAGYGTRDFKTPTFSDETILGNAFIMILAGHETTGNTLFFASILLAIRPSYQRRLQTELDSILGKRPQTEWDFDHDLPKLFAGMAGAIVNETLRLYPPVANVPKRTHSPQIIHWRGREFTVPANTMLHLTVTSANRNPNYWPHGPPTDPARPWHWLSNTTNDLEEFKPSRWLVGTNEQKRGQGQSPTTPITTPSSLFKDAPKGVNPTGIGGSGDEDDELDYVSRSIDVAATLYRPPRGAFVPFSDGPRSCIGRRFAMVEMLIVLATIFRDYTLELDVGQWATDEEVSRMSEQERMAVWWKARDEALRKLIRETYIFLTTQLKKGVHIPLRVVKRGEERFPWAMSTGDREDPLRTMYG